MVNKRSLIPAERIEKSILLIRDQKVMLDRDLAGLYGVETKQLKRAVRRNINRFPKDFMFELTKEEYDSLRYQFGTLKRGEHSKYLPMAFTEQGVAMLSSVLNSKRAIHVNIQIMRVFTRLRQMLLDNEDLRKELEGMRRQTDERFRIVFETLDQLLSLESKTKRKIGFEAKEPKARYKTKDKKRKKG